MSEGSPDNKGGTAVRNEGENVRILERIARIRPLWALLSVLVIVFAFGYTANDTNIGIVWLFGTLLLLLIGMGMCVASIYKLIRKRPIRKIAGITGIAIGITMFVNYATLMSMGNFIQFAMNFIIIIFSTMFTLFCWDLYRGKTDTLQWIRPLCMLIVVLILLYIAITIIAGVKYSIIEYHFEDSYFAIAIFVLFSVLISDQSIIKREKIRLNRFPRTLCLAVTLFMYGAVYLLRVVPNCEEGRIPLNDIASLFILIIGLYFMIYRDVDRLTSTSIMLGSLGLYTALSMVQYLFKGDTLILATGAIAIAAGAITIILSILLYSGDKYNAKRLQYIMLVLLAVFLLPILYDIRMKYDLDILIANHCDRMIGAIVVGATFLALTDGSMRYYSAKERMAYNVTMMNYAICNDSKAYIMRDELIKLTNAHPEGTGTDRLEYERRLTVSVSGSELILSVQKWKDSDILKGELIRDKDHSFIQSTRFDIKDIVFDTGDAETCSSVTLYGYDGYFMTILIADLRKDLKDDLPHRLYYRMIGISRITCGQQDIKN